MVDSDFGFGGGDSSHDEDNNGCLSDVEELVVNSTATLGEEAAEHPTIHADGAGNQTGRTAESSAAQPSEMVNPTTTIENNNNNNNNSIDANLLEEDSESDGGNNTDESGYNGANCWDNEDPLLENSIGDSDDNLDANEEEEDLIDGDNEDEDINVRSDEEDASAAVPQTQTRKRRRRFTIAQKLNIVRSVDKKIIRDGISMRQACCMLHINTKQYTDWKKKLPLFNNSPNKKVKSLSVGHPSSLKSIQQQLLSFIFELREQGMGVTTHMIVVRAAQLSRPFREKNRYSQYQVVRRFVLHHSLVYRMSTHKSQRTPSETTAEASDWLVMIRPRLNQPCRHQDFIINMDQTPVPFTYNRKKTLALIGTRTIHVRKSTNDTKQATFAMTVTASGKVLKPMLIFKGKHNGRIVQREFPTFPDDVVYACQENAWMDERQMISWVDKVIKPYVLQCPAGIIPILFLDSYRCHMMDSVVHRLQEMGVEVEHIPGGCTSLCQPVDVGVNKPFKNKIREKWEHWMVTEGLEHGTTRPPERSNITQWARVAMGELTEEVVRNAWLHDTYTWFPPSCEPRPQEQANV